MSDLVKELLSRSSDQDGIGWTPTTVVHVPVGLLHRAADTITTLRADLQKLNERNAEYIGTIDRLRRRVAETDVEIERLRAALEDVSSTFDDTYNPNSREGRLGRLARAALAEEKKE